MTCETAPASGPTGPCERMHGAGSLYDAPSGRRPHARRRRRGPRGTARPGCTQGVRQSGSFPPSTLPHEGAGLRLTRRVPSRGSLARAPVGPRTNRSVRWRWR